MTEVAIEFSNLQSHEHTQFTIKPGLNFILADDNNVGKSTIFKVLNLMTRVPNTTYRELSEVLRTGTNTGHASFRFDDSHVVFWLLREDAEKVRSFFETRAADGSTTRTAQCPRGLLNALDIVVGEDQLPINFNDADSVQLIVQDTPKNDAVLSRVLVDERVENVRYNARELDRTVLQDYKIAETRQKDADRVLNTLSFNMAVDEFNAEIDHILAATRVTDQLLADCQFSEYPEILLDKREDHVLQCIVDILRSTENIDIYAARDLDTASIDADIHLVQIHAQLSDVDFQNLTRQELQRSRLESMERAIAVLKGLYGAEAAVRSMVRAQAQLDGYEAEIANITEQLERLAPTVQCPMRGRVYYTDEKCVPCDT